jgi:hypothetical protein
MRNGLLFSVVSKEAAAGDATRRVACDIGFTFLSSIHRCLIAVWETTKT